MALSVENPAAHLTPIRKSIGSWNYGGKVGADYPGLEGIVRELLETDEAESSCERRLLGKANRLYSSPQKLDEEIRRSSGRYEGLFLTSSTRFSQQNTTYLERKPQLTSAKHSSESFNEVSCTLNHPQEQQMFCSKLEDLIQWLYKVAEVTEKWVPPKPDVESIQSALQLYLKFKKDVIGQQTVADNVVKMGEILLETMAANSPVLKDALALIAKESEALERRGERLYASVLGAMDTAADNDSRMKSDAQQAVSQEMDWMRPLEDKAST